MRDGVSQCLGLKVGCTEIRCYVKVWVREKYSGGTVLHHKGNSLAKGLKFLRYVLELEVRVAIQKVVYTLNFTLWVLYLLGCLIGLGNPLL